MPKHTSSNPEASEAAVVPRHIAIVMDGNGRWAKKRLLPRIAGHKQGVGAVRNIVKSCISHHIEFLTLFAFSSENWCRPKEEISYLMGLFVSALEQEIGRLHKNNIRFKVVGDLSKFEPKIVDFIKRGEVLTAGNTRLIFTVAANYGGRWDIMQAINKMLAQQIPSSLTKNLTEKDLAHCLALNYAPEPDLFIRTAGECRISNFMLWQLAYTELYFTKTLWPDFDEGELCLAIKSYQQRERKFGRISEQLQVPLRAKLTKENL